MLRAADLQRGLLLQNNWYVAAFSEEVGSTPLARRICDQPLVLYRTESGVAAALLDRCVHRGMPLSAGGECRGATIRCPYHGMEFDPSGICVRMPGQAHIPARARIRSYPVVEQDRFIWIWMGDPEAADRSQIVSWPYRTAPDWVCIEGLLAVRANWQLLADNLLNISHFQYLHRKTIGDAPEDGVRAEVAAQRLGNTALLTRSLRNVDAPPFHQLAGRFTSKVDRWQEAEFRPGVLRFYSAAMAAGTGACDSRRERAPGVHIRHFHGTTPETAHSTLYFFASARNFLLDDAELTERLRCLTFTTFEEDKVALEAQQARLRDGIPGVFVDMKEDGAGLYARSIVSELYGKEQEAAPPAAADLRAFS